MTIDPNDAVSYAWAAWLISWLVAAVWNSRAERRSRSGADALQRLLTTAGALLLFRHPAWRWIDQPLWPVDVRIAWTFFAVTLAGFAFTWWARITLGALWSSGVTRKVDHVIVSAGPYQLVRHPIYSGLLLSIGATTAMRGTVADVIGAAAIALGLLIKARVEERFLRQELGDDRYAAYARRVPMLVPFAPWHDGDGATKTA